MKEARHKRTNTVWFHLYEMSKISKSIETESKIVFVRDWEDEGNGSNCMSMGFWGGQIKMFGN